MTIKIMIMLISIDLVLKVKRMKRKTLITPMDTFIKVEGTTTIPTKRMMRTRLKRIRERSK